MSIDHSLETVEKAQEAANFALYLFKDCLLFEQLSQEEINLKKRKRAKLMNQICSQVDMLGIETGSSNSSSSRSPSKRAKIGSSTSSPHDVNNNNDSSLLSDEINEDEGEKSSSSFENDSTEGSPKKLAVYTLSARGNTWIGRRSIKRDLKSHHEENTNELDLERQCSLKLVEKNEQCAKEIDFKCEFVYEAAARKVNMKFTLIHDDRFSTQSDLVDFDTLVHFLHVFVNTSMEKDGGGAFSQWSAQKQQN